MKKHIIILIISIGFTNILSAQLKLKLNQVQNNSRVQSICVADFNNDGLDDIISATDGINNPGFDHKINIHLQNVNGISNITYSFSYRKHWNLNVNSLTVDDVNNDNLKDIIFTFNDSIAIYFQTNQQNVFQFQKYYCGKYATAVKTGDLNGDGLKDIVVSHISEKYIKIFYQKTIGFNIEKIFQPEYGGFALEIADIDSDGSDDIILMSEYFNTYFYIYLQKNKQILASPIIFTPSNSSANSDLDNFTVNDLDNDGFKDIVAVRFKNTPNAKIEIYLNTKSNTFFENSNSYQITAFDLPYLITTADLNCDGKLEIIVNNIGWKAISIFEQNTSGQYSAYQKFTCDVGQFSSLQAIGTGDFNNDSKIDIVVTGDDYSSKKFLNIFTNESILKPTGDVKKLIKLDTTKKIVNSIFTNNFIKIKIDSFTFFKTIVKDSFEIKKNNEKIYLTIDSTIITTAIYCSKTINDTIKKRIEVVFEKNLKIDTILLKTKIDTIYNNVEDNFILYPNPTFDEVSIKTRIPLVNNVVIVDVFDIQGRELIINKKINIKSDKIDLSDFPQATYIVIISYENKKKIFKVIKLTQ